MSITGSCGNPQKVTHSGGPYDHCPMGPTSSSYFYDEPLDTSLQELLRVSNIE